MNIINKIIIFLAKSIFFIYGFLWTIKPRKYNSIKDIINDFYINFLRIDKKYIHIIKINEKEAIVRCDNPCPILKLSMILNLDTKFVCKYISEPVCNYVLKRMNEKIIFERNYEHIRPYKESCEEHIYFKN
ncbi:MAG: hypothetical protein LM593_00155 [Candidatus Verstraetearchaeota archaeon]|jgi:hypothetical protein|nr:hypothetical protein [Candidatus Verstraetearchaeota archaeon]